MKSFKKTLLVFMAVVAVSLTSCKKDDDGGGSGPAGSGQIVANVGGTNFTSLAITSTAGIATGGGITTVTLQGNDSSGNAIVMVINGFEGPGTYEFTDENVLVYGSYMKIDVNNPTNAQTWSAPYNGSGVVGNIKVSEKTDALIKGTFNFTGKNVNGDGSLKNITDGSFNLNFN